MLTELEVRPAHPNDAARISELISQLGYDIPAAAVAQHIECLGASRDVLVAHTGESIVGCVSVAAREDLLYGFGATIEHFVVDESVRSTGVGARLLIAAEDWARAHGCAEVRLHSNVLRERAHAFYERHGYTRVKAQYQLRKSLLTK